MSADEEVLVFLIRWCRLCCIHTMQKWYMYIVRGMTFYILKGEVLQLLFTCSGNLKTLNNVCVDGDNYCM